MGGGNNTRTFEDDDEEVARAIMTAAGHINNTSADDKSLEYDSRVVTESPLR